MKLVKVYNKSGNELPIYKTSGSAGLDLRADIEDPIVLWPGQRTLVPTGLFVELPDGFELQVRPRSGLALKHGVMVMNSPGTIDSDYRGEIGVIVGNFHEDERFVINNGDRIAQAVLAKYDQVDWSLVDTVEELSDTTRGSGGFGSTGKR